MAYRKLNLSPHKWTVSVVKDDTEVFFTVTEKSTGRRLDRHASFDNKRDRERAFVAGVAAAVEEFKARVEDEE